MSQTKPKWTPGPWEVKNTADIFTPLGAANAEGTEAASNDGWHIADCDMGGLALSEVAGNSNLIAAAPDLYEALDQAVTSMLDSGYSPASVAVQAACTALAKARGES